jgi:hypothetical protein
MISLTSADNSFMSFEQPTHEELARETLLRMMCDFSEECWCAGWLSGLEFTLWNGVTTGRMGSGWFAVNERELARMKYLHELAGGWWMWAEGEDGERFVTTEEWLRIVSEHAATQEKPE